MAEQTSIEWADSTFNPWIGCTRVSPGCDHCYAAVSTPARTLGVDWGTGAPPYRTSPANWRKPVQWERSHQAFELENGRRRRVFCASLADVFDNAAPQIWRDELFDLILRTPHLDWLLLTKRIGNVPAMLPPTVNPFADVYPNVWLGATIVNQPEADRDIPKLLEIPARIRFLSCEPLLGPITVFDLDGPVDVRSAEPSPLHWIIAGGESGPKARPTHPDWIRDLRDQCAAAGVPFLFKQWGDWASVSEVAGPGAHSCFPNGATVRRVGKAVAGRTLDGVTHTAFPT